MSLDIKQCDRCGRIFQSLGKRSCPDCVELIDKAFVLVRDYIYDHQEADVVEVAEKTGVEEKMILQFLKDRRLSLARSSGLLLCEHCGKAITSGRYCEGCLKSLSKDLDSVTDSPKREVRPAQSRKMHVEVRKK